MGQTVESTYASEPITVTPSRLGLNINMKPSVDPKHQRTQDWAKEAAGAVHSQSPPEARQAASLSQVKASNSSGDSSLRIKVTWDGTTLPVRIDLNSSGDALLAQLKKSFKKKVLNREEFLFRLSTDRDPDAPGAEETVVSLNADDLKDDWPDAVAWMRSTTGIYGKIEPVNPT